ncbi:hypothetical protein JCM31826_06540 [Thermaurantimonas aggregans]|uniref:Uncharacterized protein n=1 Tax=Thermaurantimonas aggregans TaxID=2173829 RepID=A0A401XJI2_9FLAO|nr:hypothetical protein [Thermaurantimonas aggregans]MCX8148706.1 hypothetical protein [Thermaurantimonas aggregans]GCD77172.1 hypothetical protein JCM31826_06540 [Thermaurantimonas aggregans]
MSRAFRYLFLSLLIATTISCKKKSKTDPEPPIKPLKELLPGSWRSITYKASARITLSGVEYELIRSVKNGEINCVINAAFDRLYFEGQGTFETTIRVAGQNLQTMDQLFSYSQQNSNYQITTAEVNSFEMVRVGESNPNTIVVQVVRQSDNQLKISFEQAENIENLGMVNFQYEYELTKNP